MKRMVWVDTKEIKIVKRPGNVASPYRLYIRRSGKCISSQVYNTYLDAVLRAHIASEEYFTMPFEIRA
jgi:hypothetical protein